MNKLKKIVPSYAWRPLLSLFIMNIIAYYGSRIFTANAQRICMALPLDAKIPLYAPFVIIYILAYFQWIVGFICIARESKAHCRQIISGEIIAKIICMALFIAVPTEIEWPQVVGDGLFERLVRFIYWTDLPINLFPSIHCLDSWICFRGALGMRRVPKWYAPVMLAMTLLVFASTVLIKQHVFVDIPAAILVGELGLFVAKRHYLKKQIRTAK